MGESSSASYIRMVQHLIEQCLVFHMNKDECTEALAKHANIQPVITSTVWKELEKENKAFFQAYMKDQEEKALDMETVERRIQKVLAETAEKIRTRKIKIKLSIKLPLSISHLVCG